ncbi:MAG: T9SS type A sorting domain-containing protein [Bacteroidetes bacterium]|nr:T9SS type A sorting domain-containing protein [Bacteroidota bacterium]
MKHFYLFITAAFPFVLAAQITTGSFAARVDFTSAPLFNGGSNVAASDMDGDGKLDMTVTYAGPISVYRNTSTVGVINSSSFSATTADILVSGASWQAQTSDLDGDGKKDVLTSKWDSNPYGFSVFRNTSTVGNLSFAAEQIFDNTIANTKGLQLADIDGDGKDDIVACDDQRGRVVIMRNTSTIGTISFAAEITMQVPFANLRRLSVADIDGDGKKDLAVGYEAAPTIAIFQNTSTVGNISFATRVDLTTPGQPYDLSISDIDVDGHRDIVAACRFQVDQLVVLRSLMTSAGTISTTSFAAPVAFSAGVSGCDPFSIAVGNIDNDNKPDVVISNNVANTIAVFRNTSTPGSFTTSSMAAHVDFATLQYPDGVILADIDGDGKNEIIVNNSNSSGVGVFSIFRNLITPSGIMQNEISNNVQLYPNPTNENATLSFSLNQSQNVKISLYDLTGREIEVVENENMSEGEHLAAIKRNDLSAGVYFVKMQLGDVIETKKILFE